MFAKNKFLIFIFILILFGVSTAFGQSKYYVKKYFDTGQLESEGWMINNTRIEYWFFYNENGSKKEEGHYANNKKTKWWTIYDDKHNLLKKCEYKNDKLEGLAIIYKNGTIVRAEKYKMDIKIKQWETIASFKKDNFFTAL